jgi:thiamine-monophosphate kinase
VPPRETEHELITELTRLFGGAAARRVASVGIGDDAAVLSRPRGLVWTIDAAVEGVHFTRELLSLEAIGARSFHACVSDLAAMGARPLAALSNLAAPAALARTGLARVAAGQAAAARELACPVVGGNVSRASELSITTTALGVATRPLRRDGARAGDDVWLVGDVGLARVGFEALRRKRRGRRPLAEREAIDVCVHAFERPRALVDEGRRLVGRARAAIDVSDGMAGDLRHVATQSRVRITIDEAALRRALRAELVTAAAALGLDPLEAALSGGEDYAILATGPAAKRPRFARAIGTVARGRGVFLATEDGRSRPLTGGFDHFARTAPRDAARSHP